MRIYKLRSAVLRQVVNVFGCGCATPTSAA